MRTTLTKTKENKTTTRTKTITTTMIKKECTLKDEQQLQEL